MEGKETQEERQTANGATCGKMIERGGITIKEREKKKRGAEGEGGLVP